MQQNFNVDIIEIVYFELESVSWSKNEYYDTMQVSRDTNYWKWHQLNLEQNYELYKEQKMVLV